MKRTQILAVTGLGTGVVGTIAGAIITSKMYSNNKKSIESGELKEEKEIKKAKLKAGMATVGTTILAGLAIASGVGLAMSYSKEEEVTDKYFLNPNKDNEVEENEDWLMAMNEQSELVDELIANSKAQTEGLITIKDEVDEFISSMNTEIEDLNEMKEIGQEIVDIADEALEQLI